MKNVLVIAYYFPPMGMGGVQRVFKFCKYLPRFGWNPIVLTVRDVAYFAHDPTPLEETSLEVHRTESLDPLRIRWLLKRPVVNDAGTWRGLSSWLFIPDSKILWLPFAVSAARAIMRERDVSLLFATSPPRTALAAGLLLKRASDRPLVVDLRDPLEYGLRSPTILHSSLLEWTNRKAVACADMITTAYPQSGLNKAEERVTVIPNGFDPDDLKTSTETEDQFVIVHTGTLTRERKGESFFTSIKELIEQHEVEERGLRVKLIGWIDPYYEHLIDRLGLADVVERRPYVPHQESIAHLMGSSLLWLPVGRGEIPGKIYEYLGSRKPILATATPGESADLIQSTSSGTVVDPGDVEGIKHAVLSYYNSFTRGELELNAPSRVEQFSRLAQTKVLASLFDSIAR